MDGEWLGGRFFMCECVHEHKCRTRMGVLCRRIKVVRELLLEDGCQQGGRPSAAARD
jgi:hypothetical protein